MVYFKKGAAREFHIQYKSKNNANLRRYLKRRANRHGRRVWRQEMKQGRAPVRCLVVGSFIL